MTNVLIYSTSTCHYCHMAKEFFKENHIEYSEKDVGTDMDARREMIEKTGSLGVPVIQIGEETILGFDKKWLQEKLGIK
ncbi:MAG: NrdH-redoxin [Candidatus Spechtbacteria bacterium RIFCSPLOWO2_12_FULL_38_22]|uniref:NrdH-redoxin n=1 Tax=Candidatus Spechtbacteria bacterium RIFCSPLOWO2_12_FULL_38_22 TaxID=1802165 RepID=A0A1G2HIK6_9BACT|nr:MAG: NrdH-redoxin [Candidatus Spechtbacteria bacterium RIFCSPHIGHO2_01_FULL_38_11]OGZ59377.1 MAG: NrdH-redoxin [Candidatus Spechtbacteria bacterium RIFCSPLOWO2_01_FULL_38_20]OGZ59891.1 MAG: NrdH-redoxin [Candidatus Spechtbacteria bacterium RIFCSPHIGHO2_12_FULL_38_30]OGZ62061.1 MAG: NrdH-redoxin [Candidatus Spechtbacteria bacterium RIFCSPLOWO2_12_FULL_38_22]